MKPNVGDIYAVYVDKLQQYTACQVTMLKEADSGKSRPLLALLELDWTGERLPEQTELEEMRPLSCDYFFWNNRIDLSYVEAAVPKQYIKVGNIPPLLDDQTNSYGNWNVGSSIYRQRKWERIPQERRAAFKRAAKDETKVEVGGHSLRRATNAIHDHILETLSDWSELEKLPCLTKICAERPYEQLLPFINGNPFINELQWENHGCRTLDLRASNLERLNIKTGELEELRVNRHVDQLSLYGNASQTLTVHAEDDGRWITAIFPDGEPFGHGLERLGALHLNKVKELDLQPVIRRYPYLEEIRLWGKPGNVTNMSSIAQLPNLQRFTAYDMFGFTGEQFPGPDELPRLTWLWLTSVPADAARAVKDKYKKETAKGLDLSVTKPRKAEWLQENVHNPFRDWDGRDHISAAHAKKAAAVYKKTLAAIASAEQQAKDGLSAAETEQALRSVVADYTVAFNKMDRQRVFIETVEREEIYEVLTGLLGSAKEKLAVTGIPLDTNKLIDVFEELRDY